MTATATGVTVCVACCQSPCLCPGSSWRSLSVSAAQPLKFSGFTADELGTSCAPSREHAWRSVMTATLEATSDARLEAIREAIARYRVLGESSLTPLVDALLPVILAGERMMDG